MANKRNGNILLYKTYMFIVKMADHDGNHRSLIENSVPIAPILPSRWRDGAESLAVYGTTVKLIDLFSFI